MERMSGGTFISLFEPDDGKIHIDITPPFPKNDPTEPLYPFSLMSESDSLSRLFMAQAVSEPGAPLLSIVLLVKKEDIPCPCGDFRPFANPDLDRAWGQAFAAFAADEECGFFPIRGAFREGRPLPCPSLFLCTHRRRFFHPPCPRCGKTLSLCEDDDFLTARGLSPYRTSLRRYLYCPCGETPEVYAYARKDTDPALVKDRHALIRSWRDIVAGRVDAPSFPCGACPEQPACFGKSSLCEGRIVPFLFYPSPVLAFKAPSMAASDFLSLLSGASPEEISGAFPPENRNGRTAALRAWEKRGRGNRFFFEADEKHFLEILYLKLSFIGEVARLFLDPGKAPAPLDTLAAMDGLWVDLPEQSPFLPAFWNFRTRMFAVGYDAPEAGLARQASPGALLGMIWLITLLRNRRQPVRSVLAMAAALSRDTSSFDAETSAPENIFWAPDAKAGMRIPAAWMELWKDALSLGVGLLRGEIEGAFLPERLDAVRAGIREILFFKTTAEAEPDRGMDTEIHRLLLRLAEAGETPKPAALSAPVPEILAQTVVFRAEKSVSPPEPDEELSQTVVFSAGKSSLPHIPAPAEEEMTQTVVLSAGKGAALSESVRRLIEPALDDDLQETVIFGRKQPIPDAPAPPPSSPAGEEDVMATLILKPSPRKEFP